MYNPNRVRKHNHISNLYPEIIHFIVDGKVICNTTQITGYTDCAPETVTCNSCKNRMKRK